MATLHASDVADMILAIDNRRGRDKMTDIASDLQGYTAVTTLMNKKRRKIGGGIGYQWNLFTEGDDNTRLISLFSVDSVNQADGATSASVPWRYSTTGTVYDVNQAAMNASSPDRFWDFIKFKRHQTRQDWVEKHEGYFWGEPSSSTDTLTPFGVKYWLVYNAVEGFNGGNNTNFAAGPGGVSRTTFPNWSNYTANYVNVTKIDLVRKMRRAMWSCRFRPPVSIIPQYTGGAQYGIYTTYDVLREFEESLEAQNQNLGNDVASKDGRTLFRRIPVEANPYLQANEATTDPVVGIDWSSFHCVSMEGRWMVKTEPTALVGLQHNVVQENLDCAFNFLCLDCRKQFLIAKSSWH